MPAKVTVHPVWYTRPKLILERPAFLSKDGLTAADGHGAPHAFMEHADFGALAAELDADREGSPGLFSRRTSAGAPHRTRSWIRPASVGFRGAVCRIRAAEQVLRELAFITALPDVVMEAQHSPTPAAAQGEQVLVQGVADLVLVFPDHLELIEL